MQAIWELDFYSRPLRDENEKKVWEVLICESPLRVDQDPDSLFKYSQFCSHNTVNSLFLREALEKAMATAPPGPQKIRFSRRQMNNMITKACKELGILPVPSRRTYALERWLAQRRSHFYPSLPGYDPTAAHSPSVQYPGLGNAIPLPDAVRGDKGDKWAFVTLEGAAFTEMNQWDIAFGEAFPLSLVGLTPDAKIPGFLVFSNRALPLAGWLSGLEMASLEFEGGKQPKVRLETGVSDSWILANLTDSATLKEGKGFQEAKERANQVHFLAIQSTPESTSFAGFWLLKG